MTPPAAAAAPAVRRASTAAPGRPRTTAPRPRRVSGPARRGLPSPQPRPSQAQGGFALGVLEALRSIPRSRLLDRLLAGRMWIALVAFALIGIVTLQLGLLKLNASIGRALEHEALLQRQNAALSIEDSELAAGDRVEARASRLGMELVPTGALRFLTVPAGGDAARAAGSLSAPAGGTGSGSGEASAAAAAAAGSSTTPTATGEQTAAPATSPSPSAETTPGAPGQAAGAPGEGNAATSAAPPTATPPASTAPAPAANTPAGSGEATSAGGVGGAGGTQSSPAG